MSYVTPAALTLEDGTYEIDFPVSVVLNNKTYQFSNWDDGSVNPIRTIVFNQDKTVNATYVEVILNVNVTFKGTQSKQVAAGETVSITVTKPDLTTEVLTVLSLAFAKGL